MAVLPTYGTFRWEFATKVVSAPTATFADANPDTILRTDGGGDWVADGIEVGHRIQPNGTANNDNYYKVAVAGGVLLTLEDDDAVTVEGPVACATTAWFVDNDGQPQWPVDLLDSGGFTGGLSGIPVPYGAVAFEVTVNATAADVIKNADEYHWYLSQRSDVVAEQYLSISQKASTALNSYSGTVSIVHSSLAASVYNITSIIDPSVQRKLFKYMHLYVKRVSDGAIQWVDLLAAMTANVG